MALPESNSMAFGALRCFAFALIRGGIFAYFCVCLAWTKACGEGAVAVMPATEHVEFFETKIRPLFARECYRCHSDEEKKLKGDLHLDTRAGMLKGGETGAAIVPRKS